jgi:hypothetical protein
VTAWRQTLPPTTSDIKAGNRDQLRVTSLP